MYRYIDGTVGVVKLLAVPDAVPPSLIIPVGTQAATVRFTDTDVGGGAEYIVNLSVTKLPLAAAASAVSDGEWCILKSKSGKVATHGNSQGGVAVTG
jgi:hypothetical protein